MHWNLGRIYLHLKSNTKLTTLPTLCDTGKLEWAHSRITFVCNTGRDHIDVVV